MGLEKLQHIYGDLEGHAHVQGYVHDQERPWKDLVSYFWLTWRLSYQSNEGMPPHAHSISQQKVGDLLFQSNYGKVIIK